MPGVDVDPVRVGCGDVGVEFGGQHRLNHRPQFGRSS